MWRPGKLRRTLEPKIIFVNRFFHPDLSATSQLLSDLAFHLAADRRVVVIASRLRYDDPSARLPARETIRGVEVRRVATTGFGRAGLLGRSIDLASFHAGAAQALIGLARRGDVIVAKTDPPLLSIVAGWAARLKGARLVNWLQDIYPEVAIALGAPYPGGLLGGALRALRDASLIKADDNIVLGERMAAHLRAVGAPAGRVRVIANWTDEATITPIDPALNSLREAWGLTGKFVVAYSGNLGRAHEYRTMLGAAAILAGETSIAFLVIGDGHHMRSLKADAKAAGLANIVFQPYQAADALASSLSAGDVHWISLRPELEGLIFPSKVYGVLAAGRPIIAVTVRRRRNRAPGRRHGCGCGSTWGTRMASPAQCACLRPSLTRRPATAPPPGARPPAIFTRGRLSQVARSDWSLTISARLRVSNLQHEPVAVDRRQGPVITRRIFDEAGASDPFSMTTSLSAPK